MANMYFAEWNMTLKKILLWYGYSNSMNMYEHDHGLIHQELNNTMTIYNYNILKTNANNI